MPEPKKPNVEKLSPEEASAFAVLYDNDGAAVVCHNQREVDEAVKNGAAVHGGPTWSTRRNRREVRSFGRNASTGRGRERRARAHGVEHGPLVPNRDHNGRPIIPPPVFTPEQIAHRVEHERAKATRTPWRRPRRAE